MLPGILTTALEIIIILDICGAVVYFALSGLAKRKESETEATPYPPPGNVFIPITACNAWRVFPFLCPGYLP